MNSLIPSVFTAALIAFNQTAGAQATIYIRDKTAANWEGAAWTLNPITNQELAYQSAIFPYVTQGPGTIQRPHSGTTLLQLQFYIASDAPDQTILEFRPSHLRPPVAKVKLAGDLIVLELLPDADGAWVTGKSPIRLITVANRGEWNCRELLFIADPQAQTVGWTDIVNNPIDVRLLKGPTRMIRQPEDQPWELGEIAFSHLTGIYVAEVILDPNVSHNDRPNGNLRIRRQ